MDDAREWAATARRAGVATPDAVPPGNPWGGPISKPDRPGPWSEAASDVIPAGVLRRGVALAVDLVLVTILERIGWALAIGLALLGPGLHLVAQAFGFTWLTVVPVAYFVLGHGTTGRTVGKRILGVRVVDEQGASIGYIRALARCVATLLAVLPFGLGLALAVLRSDRRGLHDLLAGTRVVSGRWRGHSR
jgi:uncharacterized RDD family membrane protein YckC